MATPPDELVSREDMVEAIVEELLDYFGLPALSDGEAVWIANGAIERALKRKVTDA